MLCGAHLDPADLSFRGTPSDRLDGRLCVGKQPGHAESLGAPARQPAAAPSPLRLACAGPAPNPEVCAQKHRWRWSLPAIGPISGARQWSDCRQRRAASLHLKQTLQNFSVGAHEIHYARTAALAGALPSHRTFRTPPEPRTTVPSYGVAAMSAENSPRSSSD